MSVVICDHRGDSTLKNCRCKAFFPDDLLRGEVSLCRLQSSTCTQTYNYHAHASNSDAIEPSHPKKLQMGGSHWQHMIPQVNTTCPVAPRWRWRSTPSH